MTQAARQTDSSQVEEPSRGIRKNSPGTALLRRNNCANLIEAKRLANVLYSSTLLSALIVAYFAYQSFSAERVPGVLWLCVGIAGLCTIAALLYVMLKRVSPATFYSSLAVTSLAAGLIATGGFDGTALYWVTPLVCMQFMFLGANGGLFVSGLLLSMIAVEMFFPNILIAAYTSAQLSAALVTIMIVVLLNFGTERIRYHSHLAMKSQHIDKMVDSVTDPLTGLTNRRFLDAFYLPSCKENPVEHFPMGCVVCDVDFFKKVNDTYGHSAGDSVLIKVADLLGENVRSDDIVCRVGGEEFLLLIQKADIGITRRIAEHMRLAIEQLELPEAGGGVTASFGAAIADCYEEIDPAIESADQCLYKAKEAGRNRVHCHY